MKRPRWGRIKLPKARVRLRSQPPQHVIHISPGLDRASLRVLCDGKRVVTGRDVVVSVLGPVTRFWVGLLAGAAIVASLVISHTEVSLPKPSYWSCLRFVFSDAGAGGRRGRALLRDTRRSDCS